VKEPGFPGFFVLRLLPNDTVYHLNLEHFWNVFCGAIPWWVAARNRVRELFGSRYFEDKGEG
jgi:hypothetical protein